jgi:hypothetical protein
VKLIEEVRKRTGGRTDILITSDEHAPYEVAITKVYGEEVTPQRNQGQEETRSRSRWFPLNLVMQL